MADRDEVNRSGGVAAGTIAVIALVVAIIALWLAWMAYERTGGDLDQRIEQQVEESINALDAGPDGIDEDTTDTNTNGGTDTTAPDDSTNTTEPDPTTDGTTEQQQQPQQ